MRSGTPDGSRRGSVKTIVVICLLGLVALGLGLWVVGTRYGETAAPSGPASEGELLYRRAFETLRDRHWALQDPNKREAWAADWGTRFDGGRALKTKKDADAAIVEMLDSLGVQFDHYDVSESVAPSAAVAQPSSADPATVPATDPSTEPATDSSKNVSPLGPESEESQSDPPLELPQDQVQMPDFKRTEDSRSTDSEDAEAEEDDLTPFEPEQDALDSMRSVDNGSVLSLDKEVAQQKGAAKDEDAPVSLLDLGDGRFYVAIYHFRGDEPFTELRSALSSLKDPKGLIIDLRLNGGGDVGTALHCIELFVDYGKILTQRERDDDELSQISHILFPDHRSVELSSITEDGKYAPVLAIDVERVPLAVDKNLPLVVLTSRYTASCAEMMTAALRQCRGAHLIGERTYGKGVFQAGMPLGDGRIMYYTRGEYRVDQAVRIHGQGILPDQLSASTLPKVERTTRDIILALEWLNAVKADSEYLAERDKVRNWPIPEGNAWIIGPSLPLESQSLQVNGGRWMNLYFFWLFWVTFALLWLFWSIYASAERRRVRRRQNLSKLLVRAGYLGEIAARCRKFCGKEPLNGHFEDQAALLRNCADAMSGDTESALMQATEDAIASAESAFSAVAPALVAKTEQLIDSVHVRIKRLFDGGVQDSELDFAVERLDMASQLIASSRASKPLDAASVVNAWTYAVEAYKIAKKKEAEPEKARTGPGGPIELGSD